jgi:hypothetical protein
LDFLPPGFDFLPDGLDFLPAGLWSPSAPMAGAAESGGRREKNTEARLENPLAEQGVNN